MFGLGCDCQYNTLIILIQLSLHCLPRDAEWTGAYVMEFQQLISSTPVEVRSPSKEARFSFIHGGYVEDSDLQGSFLPVTLMQVVFFLLL